MMVQDYADHERSQAPQQFRSNQQVSSPTKPGKDLLAGRVDKLEKDIKAYKTKNDAAVKKLAGDIKKAAGTDLTKKVTTLEASLKKAVKDLETAKKDITKQLKSASAESAVRKVENQIRRVEMAFQGDIQESKEAIKAFRHYASQFTLLEQRAEGLDKDVDQLFNISESIRSTVDSYHHHFEAIRIDHENLNTKIDVTLDQCNTLTTHINTIDNDLIQIKSRKVVTHTSKSGKVESELSKVIAAGL